MKEPSPLVPQGSFEAQARSKSRVKLAFYTIVAIHVLAIGGFLIIGCKRDDTERVAEPAPETNDLATVPPIGSDPAVTIPALTNTNPAPAFTETQPPPANVGVPTTPTSPSVPPFVPSNPAPIVPDTSAIGTATAAPMTEHTIVKGDTFDTLARKYGVPLREIVAANANLNPTRLKIGDKVKIPPKSATTAGGNGSRAAAVTDPGTYKVKSGDTLSRIAAAHRTTVRELQRMNNLTTTQIKVGQTLKVPSTSNPSAATSGGTAVPGTTPPPPAQ